MVASPPQPCGPQAAPYNRTNGFQVSRVIQTSRGPVHPQPGTVGTHRVFGGWTWTMAPSLKQEPGAAGLWSKAVPIQGWLGQEVGKPQSL